MVYIFSNCYVPSVGVYTWEVYLVIKKKKKAGGSLTQGVNGVRVMILLSRRKPLMLLLFTLFINESHSISRNIPEIAVTAKDFLGTVILLALFYFSSLAWANIPSSRILTSVSQILNLCVVLYVGVFRHLFFGQY